MLDWLIIGGGLHGSHIALRLTAACPEAQIAVLDPGASALTAWQRRANACGMYFLRSSQAHHLGLRADALRMFARAHGLTGPQHALGRYRRPSRPLFEAHVDALTMPVTRIAATAVAIEAVAGGWRVLTRTGATLRARRVVLVPGPPAPARPRWGKHLPHVLDDNFSARYATWPARQHVVVVGGGLSAAQRAIACARQGHAVTLLTRHRLQQAAFDSNPCFSGPRCMQPFLRRAMAERPALLAAARNPGTLPPDIDNKLATLLDNGTIEWQQGEVRGVRDDGLQLTGQRRIHADRVILATGFAAGAGELLDTIATRLQLPLDENGYAAIDRHLAWAPGLHVGGRPASLQLGPMAGNIRGAQLAAKRLARVVVEQQPKPADMA